jgi:hypothetical protein
MQEATEKKASKWPRRSRNWALGHGAVYDERTGKLVQKRKQIAEPLKNLSRQSPRFKRGSSIWTERTTS